MTAGPGFAIIAPVMRHLRILILLAIATVPGSADAAFEGTLNMEVRIPDGAGGFRLPQSDQEQNEYFNLANCVCNTQFQLEIEFSPQPANMNQSEGVHYWYGQTCNLVTNRTGMTPMCELDAVNATGDVDEFLDGEFVTMQVHDLMAPRAAVGVCPTGTPVLNSVWVIADAEAGMDQTNAQKEDIKSDAQPPPIPSNFNVTGTENAIAVSFTPPDTREEDVDNYQLLCARADLTLVAEDNFGTVARNITQEYLTAAQVCGSTAPSGAVPVLTTERSPATPLPTQLQTLDPSALCATATSGSSSLRVDGLQNGVTYRVVLLVTDEARNVTALDIGEVTPTPSVDFWELYRMQGGTAEGGCSNAGQTGLALLLVLLAIVAFRLRRRGRRFTVIALLLCVSAPSALAQDGPDYWDEQEAAEQPGLGRVPFSRWNVELKGGPYYPDVDVGETMASFQTMFGNKRAILSKVSVDFFVFRAFGQFGLTGSVGFMTKKADAFQANLDGSPMIDTTTGEFLRATGDKNSFRLIPASLGVVYRFSVLDDYYKLPLIPYAKASLAYYTWWVKKGNGDTARASLDPTCNLEIDPTCPSTKAFGGSLGFEGVVGIAFRAESLDQDAAMAMRNDLGVEHAGVFAEFMYADVDGFDSARKLSVGDKTWLVGINFEF